MPLWFMVTDGESAGRLARKLLTRAVALSVGARGAEEALGHTIEGLLVPLAREEAPQRTGELAGNLRVRATATAEGYSLGLVSDSPHMAAVVEGTGIYHTPDAHEEWDVYGLQAFTTPAGDHVVTMHTHHKGQHPDDFPGRALERAQPFIAAAADATGRHLVSLVWE